MDIVLRAFRYNPKSRRGTLPRDWRVQLTAAAAAVSAS
jgi:hypothetical protein